VAERVLDGCRWVATSTSPGGDIGYTVQAVDVGAALVNNAFDRGGLELGVSHLNPGGGIASIEQNRRPNGDRMITPVLPAGRYVVHTNTTDTQIYPETNTMDVKTVQGNGGIYGVRLTESPGAGRHVAHPVLEHRGWRQIGDGHLHAQRTGPVGDVRGRREQPRLQRLSHRHVRFAEANRVDFPITARSSSTDLQVTLTASARVGPSKSVGLTVRR
jgi:hypothetical protein